MVAYSHEQSALHQIAVKKAGKLYEDKDSAKFHGKGLGEEMAWLHTHWFRAQYEGWEAMQV